jgi:hypothetical protein
MTMTAVTTRTTIQGIRTTGPKSLAYETNKKHDK